MEPSSKASKNFKLWILTKFEEKIIQVIFLDLKVHWNQVQKCLETSKDCKLVKVYGFKSPKSWRTSTTIFEDKEHSKNKKNIHPNHSYKSQSSSGIKIQSLQKLQRFWFIKTSSDSSSKALKNFHHKSSKIKKIRRTHKEHEKREEQEISNKHIAKDSSQFHFKDLSIHFSIQVEDILCSSQDYIEAILELKTFLRRSNHRIILLY